MTVRLETQKQVAKKEAAFSDSLIPLAKMQPRKGNEFQV
jgi:hypothetical protein